MSELQSTIQPAARHRPWLITAFVGFILVAIPMLTVALTLADKAHFGWLVGSMFLEIVSGGVIVGAVVLIVGAWKLPERMRWQGLTLLIWGLIALTSPAFGFLFLFPWGVLAIALPLVIAAFVTLFRRSA